MVANHHITNYDIPKFKLEKKIEIYKKEHIN